MIDVLLILFLAPAALILGITLSLLLMFLGLAVVDFIVRCGGTRAGIIKKGKLISKKIRLV